MSYDVEAIRKEFPALHQEVHGKPLVYLDNAATTMRHASVLEAMRHYHEVDNSNIHRGVHELSMRATKTYEDARTKVRKFIGGATDKELIYTKGTTDSINLVASTVGRQKIGKGQKILVAESEHHSNLVPWQMIAREKGAEIVKIPLNDDGTLDDEAYEFALAEGNVAFVTLGHVSNALGTVNPVKSMAKAAHDVGALVLVDGAQAIPHMQVDVAALGCDFYAASAHKMYGPTGTGFLWGKQKLLDAAPPYQGGGDMIMSVSFEKTTYNELPYKFEAGTPHIAGAIGMGAAADFLSKTGLDAIHKHEDQLLRHATDLFVDKFPTIRIIGTAKSKAGVLSFHFDEVHPHDMGTMLDTQGIAVRTGHHCAQPTMIRYGVPATTRASFGCYNTIEEVETLVSGVAHVLEMFS